MKVPLIIVTGYLGSGKTTFLKRIIENIKDKKIAIIMNEFGEIVIDAEVIKGKAVNMVELSGGCVCCSLTGELEYAIKEIIEKVKPDYILIETTGIAEPDAIILNIENIKEVMLDNVITIVDCDSIIRFPEIGYTGRIQIEMGDFILLNKADLVNEEQFKLVQQKVREINDRAVLFKTVYCNGNLDYTLFFGYFIEKDVKSKTHIYHENIEYLYFEYEGKFSREKFEDFLSNLPNEIYRGKGFVIFEDGSYLFNFIAKRVNFEPFEYNKNKLLFIGEGISKYKEKLNEELIKILK
jgi:G3E family GTPase